MKHVPLLALIAITAVTCMAEPKSGDDGWTRLFEGKSFDGWTFDVLDGSKPETIWSIEDGTIMGRDLLPVRARRRAVPQHPVAPASRHT